MNKYLLTATVLLSGCAPLQQAPLVYTSKQVLGIDISAPTTESAGISLNVGFKNIDAAYVPVAVSKENGQGKAGEVIEIYATSGEGKKQDPTRENIEQKKEAEKLTQTLETKKEELNVLNTAKIKITQKLPINTEEPLKENQSILQQLTKVVSIPDEAKEKLEKGKPLTAELAPPTLETINKEIGKTEAQIDSTRKKIAEAFDKSKTDAMSVFGSFDSGVKGDKSTGVLHNLGKVFSTGVAAQNLTEGLQKYAFLQQCLDLIKNTEDKSQKTALINMCTNPIGTPPPKNESLPQNTPPVADTNIKQQ